MRTPIEDPHYRHYLQKDGGDRERSHIIMIASDFTGYQDLVQFGIVHRRVEQLAQDLADFADRLNATICKLAGTSDPPLRYVRATGHIEEFWDQYERDVDRRLQEMDRRSVVRPGSPARIHGDLKGAEG